MTEETAPLPPTFTATTRILPLPKNIEREGVRHT